MTQKTEKKSIDESLAEKRAEEKKVVLELKVNDDNNLECKTSDGWETVCTLKEISNHSFDRNTKLIESARQEYQELQTKVKSVLNEDGYWKVEYQYISDKESDYLIVPIKTSITDNVKVYQIHDEELKPKNEYVDLLESENLKRNDTLYAKNLKGKSIYKKTFKMRKIDRIFWSSYVISYIILTAIFIGDIPTQAVVFGNIYLTVFLSIPIWIFLATILLSIYMVKKDGLYMDYEKVL